MRPLSPLVTVPPPPDGIYRLARDLLDPFEPPDRSLAGDDGTFGNRFDDPGSAPTSPNPIRFRVVYCATQRLAAFGETLARFRPSLSLLTQLGLFDDDEPLANALGGVDDATDPTRAIVPAGWRVSRFTPSRKHGNGSLSGNMQGSPFRLHWQHRL